MESNCNDVVIRTNEPCKPLFCLQADYARSFKWSPQPNVERQICALVCCGQVANLRIMANWRSGLTHQIFILALTGSNPVFVTKIEGRILREMKTVLSAVLAAVGIQDESCKATSQRLAEDVKPLYSL